jgi:hypothetical protein
MADTDDRRWLEDMTASCAAAAMWGMPIWPMLPPRAMRRDRLQALLRVAPSTDQHAPQEFPDPKEDDSNGF